MKDELNNLLNAVKMTDTFSSPFLHINVNNIFSVDYYNEIVNNLPPREYWKYTSHNPNSWNKNPNRMMYWPDSPEKYKIFENEVFRSFVSITLNEDFKNEILSKFKVRNLNDDTYSSILFCWDGEGYSINPHPDTHLKIVTLQIPITPNNFYTEDSAMHLCKKNNGMYESVKLMKWEMNSLMAFKRSDYSYHLVKKIKNPNRMQAILAIYKKGVGPSYDFVYDWKS